MSHAQQSDEIFDRVDEHDCVIGQAPRPEVHARKWHHRAVHVFVWNGRGELFLQFRSRLKVNHPQVWDSSCSGHVSAGQDYHEAAVRELGEELGVPESKARKIRPAFKIATCAETEQEHVWLYEMEDEGPFTLQPEEVEDGRFFKPEDIDQMISTTPEQFAPAFVHIWKLYRGQQKS
ncbi:NUDIX domain-containing protein [Kamptonema cortianum]|nr:NUDIX domain-containing protein [Oscillatoria laete-virens]MDK3157925.1 NUDIX domain-containing protein [Kamptonema cortianum]MDL5046053.1 NUDIX domain-containing protein [Oscillatoria amoena NRMC-F 0135]MDL5052760.1 NUDIX domain-containing protein [Oscillatoria laete-virens NRMC-F 0139]